MEPAGLGLKELGGSALAVMVSFWAALRFIFAPHLRRVAVDANKDAIEKLEGRVTKVEEANKVLTRIAVSLEAVTDHLKTMDNNMVRISDKMDRVADTATEAITKADLALQNRRGHGRRSTDWQHGQGDEEGI